MHTDVDDRDRVAAIEAYNILDTPAEREFDDLAALAAAVCGTPIALVTFVTSDRQWFKARVGCRLAETPLDVSFCAVAITQSDVLIVGDTLQDSRFHSNPLVTGEPHVRFYAGAPLVTSAGHALGTVCVLDRVARELTASQVDALRAIARQVVSQLELRRAHEAMRVSEEFTRRILDSSMDCIKVLDLDGRLLSMNEGGMRALDICDFAPFCGAEWPTLWPAESQDMVRRAVNAARHGGIERFVGFCPTTIGTPKWWDVAVSPICDRDGRPERILAVSRDITATKQSEQLLQSIAEGTAAATGDAFFNALVKHLAEALQVSHVFVAECLPNKRARARAHWTGQDFGANFEYDLTGTPCMGVVEGSVCCYPQNLQQLFPADTGLVSWKAESYVGVPLLNAAREVIGHLVVIDDKPLASSALWISALQTFAGRAGAELERQQADEKLRAAMAEVERLKNQLHAENVYLQEEIHREHNFEELVGNSPSLLDALHKVERVAPTDTTVLILGETGTGKELFARAIHRRSKRSERPLVKVNCGAIAPGLVESELFGHVKGAFTGAIDKRVGRFELANGGTIFLDEVGELPLEAQVKLLRVLQEQEFEPVGSSRTVKVNVRVIAATNRNLNEAVAEGKFRRDLLYRLNVFPIEVPPLRERKSDLPLLIGFFSAGLARKLGKPIRGFGAPSLQRMMQYSWPGNVRELQNVIERAAILAQAPVLDLSGTVLGDSAPAAADSPRASAVAIPWDHVSLDEVQRLHIINVLKQTGGVVEGARGAATILGLHPNTLRSRMKKLGITLAQA
jgi:PAS domain S-box-containing protein